MGWGRVEADSSLLIPDSVPHGPAAFRVPPAFPREQSLLFPQPASPSCSQYPSDSTFSLNSLSTGYALEWRSPAFPKRPLEVFF